MLTVSFRQIYQKKRIVYISPVGHFQVTLINGFSVRAFFILYLQPPLLI
jgi:hypothetical protein